MTTYKVSFQKEAGTPYCTNIVTAETAEAVEKHFSGCNWLSIAEATDGQISEAEIKGVPLYTIKIEKDTEEETEDEDIKEAELTGVPALVIETETSFELLRDRVWTETHRQIKDNCFFIYHGYMPSWAEEYRNDPDKGLKYYSTDTRWNQYKSGKIDRAQACEFACARMRKAEEKKLDRLFEKIEAAEMAKDTEGITIHVEYSRNYNPCATVITDSHRASGHASGYGYDKTSTAIAEAFNALPEVQKILYSIKEEALRNGVSDYSATACTHVDNRECCGYGAGYTALPYFEGGVGVNCFYAILEKAGYKIISSHEGKRDLHVYIERTETEAQACIN